MVNVAEEQESIMPRHSGRDEGRMGKAVEKKEFAGLSLGKVGGLIFAGLRWASKE